MLRITPYFNSSWCFECLRGETGRNSIPTSEIKSKRPPEQLHVDSAFSVSAENAESTWSCSGGENSFSQQVWNQIMTSIILAVGEMWYPEYLYTISIKCIKRKWSRWMWSTAKNSLKLQFIVAKENFLEGGEVDEAINSLKFLTVVVR